MATEIERKFLVATNVWRLLAAKPTSIRQGYLSKDPERVVRVRRIGDEAYLTIKSSFGKSASNVLSRTELEYEIPVADATFILDNLCLAPIIEKCRYQVIEADGKRWEVDEFITPHPNLVLAEIELSHSEDQFDRPSWLGCEVTHDQRYSNNNIGTAVLG